MYDNVRLIAGYKGFGRNSGLEPKEQVNQPTKQPNKYPDNQTNNQNINPRQTLACRLVSRPVRWYYFCRTHPYLGNECSGISIYLTEIRKYLGQENQIMLDSNVCVDWVAFFIGEASSCLLSSGRFRFRLRVSAEALSYICLIFAKIRRLDIVYCIHSSQNSHLVFCCGGGKWYFQASRMRS